MRINPILNVDSYKTSHFAQYPEGTEYVYSYIESRGGKFDRTLFFGLQAFIKEYLSTRITLEDIQFARDFCRDHGVPFNYDGWMHIYRYHNGILPVEIHAVPEGYIINNNNVLLTIQNTDPKVPWVTSYIETALLRAIWYPTTVATKSWYIRQTIKEYYEATSDADPSEIDFKLVDFGARGVSSLESAALGGMGHLVNFKATDTISAVLAARHYYNEPMAGFSIAAAEHSTITSWGKENEVDAYRNMINQFGNQNAFAVVSDSYDITNAVENIWGTVLKDEVNACGATVIIRPDSGHPVHTPIAVIGSLMEKFGYTTNSKGYMVLPNNIRVLQGDGINEDTVEHILACMADDYRYSAENIIFGMGGGLLQDCTRDTQKFAMKCSAIRVNGEWRDVYKEAPGKNSKRGRFALLERFHQLGTYDTVPHDGNVLADVLRLVYRNGDLMIDDTFPEIRNRALTF